MTFSVIDANNILNGKIEHLKQCYFCGIKFNTSGFDNANIVSHHSHLKPYNFSGFAHNRCNLRGKLQRKISCLIFNASGYDTKFILQIIGKFKNEKLFCIPKSSEKFISVGIGCIQIIDAMSFFQSSLEQAVHKIYDNGKGGAQFKIVEQEFKYEIDHLNLPKTYLFAKSLFPYNLITSYKEFERRDFHKEEYFFNDLKDSPVSVNDLDLVKQIWSHLKINTLGELCSFYVRLDCCLLASVFLNLRSSLYEEHGLDIAQYMSLSSFAYHSCLKKPK